MIYYLLLLTCVWNRKGWCFPKRASCAPPSPSSSWWSRWRGRAWQTCVRKTIFGGCAVLRNKTLNVILQGKLIRMWIMADLGISRTLISMFSHSSHLGSAGPTWTWKTDEREPILAFASVESWNNLIILKTCLLCFSWHRGSVPWYIPTLNRIYKWYK